jgi:hypothetical protein
VLRYHFERLHFDSFLLNHSSAYVLAMVIAFGEFFMTDTFFLHKFQAIYDWSPIVLYVHLGLTIVLLFTGHFFRTMAEMTAQRSFNHMI